MQCHYPSGMESSLKIWHFVHTVYLCVLCGSENKPIISLYSINWLVCITETECVYCAVRTGSLYTARFNIQQFYILPTQCIYVFCVDLRTNWLFPYTTLTDCLCLWRCGVFTVRYELNICIFVAWCLCFKLLNGHSTVAPGYSIFLGHLVVI